MPIKINTKKDFEDLVLKNWNQINSFIDEMNQGLPVPIYSSVDIREGVNKYAPVDTNLYPAGFNNVCMLDLNLVGERLKNFILQARPNAKRVCILPESNTKNLFYLDHLCALKKTLEKFSFEVFFATPDRDLFEGRKSLELVNQSGSKLTFFPLIQEKTTLIIEHDLGRIEPDFILLNHDQSQPLPLDWDLNQTPVHPSPYMGWITRRKTQHFCYYHQVLKQFCEKFGIEIDLLEAKFRAVDGIDFNTKAGLEKLAQTVEELKTQLGPEATLFIKGDQGTYGMGISVVTSGAEVLEMNRKTRNKMDIGKNHLKFGSVIVQEGVETILKYNDGPAEISIYLVGGKSVGGFMRTNPERGFNANLNSRGMLYQKFCISEIQENSDHKIKEATYSIIARLATTAAAYEIRETHQPGAMPCGTNHQS